MPHSLDDPYAAPLPMRAWSWTSMVMKRESMAPELVTGQSFSMGSATVDSSAAWATGRSRHVYPPAP